MSKPLKIPTNNALAELWIKWIRKRWLTVETVRQISETTTNERTLNQARVVVEHYNYYRGSRK